MTLSLEAASLAQNNASNGIYDASAGEVFLFFNIYDYIRLLRFIVICNYIPFNPFGLFMSLFNLLSFYVLNITNK